MKESASQDHEIVVAIAVTDSERPLPPVGGLAHGDVAGTDGLTGAKNILRTYQVHGKLSKIPFR
ncbi:hypothetical protein AB8B21_31415 [Tardiphaga sp. 866_E4_N2_1]|uniref:hypothetical protein n=1 Tax=unclassified Tardiphaga TaxID=2631404 RepID=UPI003F1FC649